MKSISQKTIRVIFLVSCFLSLVSASAQAPQKMSYQAVIRNASNTLVANTNIRMRISVLQGTATGTAVYVETQTATTNANGLVTLEIGAGTVVSGTFASIAWGTNAYFIKTETDPTGGTNYNIVGTSQFLSVPYALFASSGNTGPAGPIGATGPAGPIGLTGATGAVGPQGVPGTNGAVGATGPQGPIGLTGATGTQGLQGVPGAANISGTTNKIIKFIGTTSGGDSQISDDASVVKIQPNGYTGYTNGLSKLEIAGNDNTLRLIGTGPDYGEFGKVNFGDLNRVFISEDIDDNMQISSYGRLAIIGGNVGVGTLTPAEKLDVSGKTKTTDLQVTTGAGLGKVLTSDATGNASWQTPTASTGVVNQFTRQICPSFSTTTQGSQVDIPLSNVTVPASGYYLVSYFMSANNSYVNACSAPCTAAVPTGTFSYLFNKTSGFQMQSQKIDFLDQNTFTPAQTATTIYSLPSHDISGSLVEYLTQGDLIGFKIGSFVSGPGVTATISANTVVTLIRLY